MRAVCAILAALAGVAATAPPAWSSFPGLNGPLAYEAGSSGSPDIFSLQPLGDSPDRRLTSAGGADRDAAWSADGRRIVFTSERDGNAEIYLMNADGSGQTRLTADPALDADPTFSPDGTRVAFTSTRDGNPEIYAIALDGSGETRLTENPAVDQQPDWSPDGASIAFESTRDGNMEIYTMDPASTAVTRLTFDPGIDADASWHPDNGSIAYVTGSFGTRTIFSVTPGTPGRNPLTRFVGDYHFPAWSPDGKQLAFSNGFGSTFVMEADRAANAFFATSGIDVGWGPLPPPDPVPEFAETVNVRPTGSVFVRIAGSVAAAPLVDPREIPVGSTIDTRRGEVEVEAAARDEQSTSSVIVSEGLATLSQTAGRDPTTVLRLPRARCPRSRRGRNRVATRRLRTRGRGRIRTQARFSDATAQGAVDWLTADRCESTLTKVTSGRVIVRDLRRRQRYLVRAGGSFLVTASGGRCKRRRCKRLGITADLGTMRGAGIRGGSPGR